DSSSSVFDVSPLAMGRGPLRGTKPSATPPPIVQRNPLEISCPPGKIMVSRPRGRHVLPHQDLRPTLLPPDRREPLGGRTTPPAGPRHPRTARPAPAVRPARRPARLGRPPGPLRPPALGPCPGATAHHHCPTHRAGPRLRAALATDRLPAGHRA